MCSIIKSGTAVVEWWPSAGPYLAVQVAHIACHDGVSVKNPFESCCQNAAATTTVSRLANDWNATQTFAWEPLLARNTLQYSAIIEPQVPTLDDIWPRMVCFLFTRQGTHSTCGKGRHTCPCVSFLFAHVMQIFKFFYQPMNTQSWNNLSVRVFSKRPSQQAIKTEKDSRQVSLKKETLSSGRGMRRPWPYVYG